MTLFSLLISLALERLFKSRDQQQLDFLFQVSFNKIVKPTLLTTVLLCVGWAIVFALLFCIVNGLFFGLLTLLMSILMCWFCIGAGIIRSHYRAYLSAAAQGDEQAMENMMDELSLIHGLPDDNSARLSELQNALLWINFRYYVSPILWYITLGPIALGIYALIRSYQTWLARQKNPVIRKLSAVDRILFWLDWLPIRLVGIVYVIMGNGDKSLPVWLASLKDVSTPQYQILTDLAQLSLKEKRNDNPVLMPIAAVKLAKKVNITLLIIISLLTIYGAII